MDEHLEDSDTPYWTLTPADAPNGGTITVMLRANEHGPLEVAPANDLGWFERYGCEPSELVRMLDLALYDLSSDTWRSDPYQGLP